MSLLHRTLFALFTFSLLLLSACPLSTNCEGLVYNEALNTCECPEGTMPNYELEVCEGDDGRQIPWSGLPVPYDDAGPADMGASDAGADATDANTPDMTMRDLGIADMGRLDSGPDAGPAPANAQSRFPWNGFTTGSVHVPDAEPIVNHPLRPKFMWEETDGTDHYQIQMTRECGISDFRECAFSRNDLDETTTETTFHPARSLTVSRIVPVGSRYFWRVRACSASEVCSDWTEVRYLDVGRDDHDFNGDGYADLAVGATFQSVPTTAEGAVYVYAGGPSGLPTTPTTSLSNPTSQPHAHFGTISALGDINADGFADLLVGASGQAAPLSEEGRAYLYYGGPSGLDEHTILDTPGDTEGSRYGQGVGGLGDINGDGYRDFGVGAPRLVISGADSGVVQLYLGGPEFDAVPSFTIGNPGDGTGSAREFGASLSGVGDLNGDGLSDFVVGAPIGSTAYVFFGLSGPSPETSTVVIGRGSFGRSIASPDLNGDGLTDLVIGASSSGTRATPLAGQVSIYMGGLGGVEAIPDIMLNNPRPGDRGQFGASVSRIADVDGDGFEDLVIGAANQDIVFEDAGAAYVYRGSPTGILAEPTVVANPDAQNGKFGISSTSVDMNGDGYADVVVGAILQDLPEMDEGAVYVLSGAPAGPGTRPSVTLQNPANQPYGLFGTLER